MKFWYIEISEFRYIEDRTCFALPSPGIPVFFMQVLNQSFAVCNKYRNQSCISTSFFVCRYRIELHSDIDIEHKYTCCQGIVLFNTSILFSTSHIQRYIWLKHATELQLLCRRQMDWLMVTDGWSGLSDWLRLRVRFSYNKPLVSCFRK